MKNILLCLAFIGVISFQPMPKLTLTTLPSYVAQGKTVLQINSSWNKVNQYLPDLNYTFEDAEEDCFSFDDEDGLQIDLIWSV